MAKKAGSSAVPGRAPISQTPVKNVQKDQGYPKQVKGSGGKKK
jgi:hypothetical protein